MCFQHNPRKKATNSGPGRVDLDVAQLSWASSLTAECFFPFPFFSVGGRFRCTPNPGVCHAISNDRALWLSSPTAPCKRSAFQRQQQRADTWLTGFACASSGRSNLCASVDDDRSTPQQSSDSAPAARPGHETLAQRASTSRVFI
jgi:hypothetical protein